MISQASTPQSTRRFEHNRALEVIDPVADRFTSSEAATKPTGHRGCLPCRTGSERGDARINLRKIKIEFFGSSLVIPCFFIVTGFLISPITFFHSIVGNSALVVGVILALLSGKGIAAEVARKIFHYTRATRKTVWSLTPPQVAATLAAALVARDTLSGAGSVC